MNVGGVMVAGDALSPRALVDHVRRLEALGYDSAWITDVFGREIYVTAGHLLAHTDRIKVASGIAHIYGRDPIASRQAGLTLSELSGGRFIQGLGVSHPIAARIAAHIDGGATEIELAALPADRSGRGGPWDLLEALAPT